MSLKNWNHLALKLKSKLETYGLESGEFEEEEEEEDEDEEESEIKRETESSVADSVKSYLRDIGKIPLLNKKTETTIADQISQSKNNSIEAISRFPFLHKEFVLMGEKLEKNILNLKDIIQFSEFDEDNIPKVEEEKQRFVEYYSRQLIASLKMKKKSIIPIAVSLPIRKKRKRCLMRSRQIKKRSAKQFARSDFQINLSESSVKELKNILANSMKKKQSPKQAI